MGKMFQGVLIHFSLLQYHIQLGQMGPVSWLIFLLEFPMGAKESSYIISFRENVEMALKFYFNQ